MQPFVFNTTASIVFQNGAAAEAGSICVNKLGKRVLLITDKGLVSLGLVEPAIKSLKDAGCTVDVFDDVEADPSQATLNGAISAAKSCDATGIIGFGGGSSMDVAKLAALIAGSGEDLEEAWGVGLAKGPRLPLVLVPTTAGTGSEVTPVSIITVGENEKRGVSSSLILPDIALLDPELTRGLPAHITAATGIDAMVHAIEAYTSKNANNNPMSRYLAVEALKLLGANIHTAVFSGDDMDARGAMLLGSMLAGMAFANSPVAAVHALAYPVGGMFHVAHGLSNALVLPAVMRFNAVACAARYAELAPHLFPDMESSGGTQEVCSLLIESLADLAKNLGLETQLRQVGVAESDLPVMASEAMKQTRLLVNNPREVSEADALAIYKASW